MGRQHICEQEHWRRTQRSFSCSRLQGNSTGKDGLLLPRER